jgi:hypothetical protein
MKPWAALVGVALCACGSTSGALVTFRAAAAGPADAVAGQPLTFSSSPVGASGSATQYQVTLTRARLHIGAVYLNRSVPLSGAQAQSCVLNGIYSGQVTSPLDVDLLSPQPQAFSADGEGTADLSQTGEVWLFGTDPFASDDTTVIVDVAGTAAQGATSIAFTGQFTIGAKRLTPPSNPALPGQFPLCKQRIITEQLATPFKLAQGGTLLLRIDPRPWFANVDFAQLPFMDPANPDPAHRKFYGDGTAGVPDANFYQDLHTTSNYAFYWQSP